MKGKIIKYYNEKGYGFIEEKKGNTLFFHNSQIKFQGDIENGTIVEYEYGNNHKGKVAKNIRKVKKDYFDNLISFIEHQDIDDGDKKQLLINLAKFRETELHVLIVGPTGAGKSSTINALFDMEVAKVGYGFDPQTTDIKFWKIDNLVLHDTPGLGDGEEQDRRFKSQIIDELHKKNPDGSALIDVVLVIIDGSHRDMGTARDLINNVVIPNIEDKKRILIAVNKCDMVLGGTGWNINKNCPTKGLQRAIEKKVDSVARRVKESSDVDIIPIYYSALKEYNISKLLSYVIEYTPIKKRFFFIGSINKKESIWQYDDLNEKIDSQYEDLKKSINKIEKRMPSASYQKKVKRLMNETFNEVSEEISKGSKVKLKVTFENAIRSMTSGVKSGMEIGAELGGIIPVIGTATGKVVGGIIGGIGGLFKSVKETTTETEIKRKGK